MERESSDAMKRFKITHCFVNNLKNWGQYKADLHIKSSEISWDVSYVSHDIYIYLQTKLEEIRKHH